MTTFAVGRGALPHSQSVYSADALDVDGTTTVTDDQANLGGTGLIVTIVTANGANSPSVTFTVQGKDKATGSYYDLLASAAVVTDTTTVLMIHPALTVVANSRASALVPDVWRVKAVGGAAAAAVVDIDISACLVP